MRRLLGAIVASILGSTVAAGQSPRLLVDGSLIVQPSYGSSSRWLSTATRSPDGFAAPAIPVVLSASERSYVNSGGYESAVPPCAGEPFFVYQPSTPVPYWAWGSLFGPDAGMWPPSRVDGGPYSYSYYASTEYRSSVSRSYLSRSYSPSYSVYASWYPYSGWYGSGGWYVSNGWYPSSAWTDYSAFTRSTYSVSTYRTSYGWFDYPWGSYWYRPWGRRPRLLQEPIAGHWQLPNGPCYTRDQRGQVVVM